MLFWGQQGVSPNLQAAVKHYERGAVRLEDTVSMYDYAIVLLKVRFPTCGAKGPCAPQLMRKGDTEPLASH